MRFRPGFVGSSVTAAPDSRSITFIDTTDDVTNATTYTFAAHPIGDAFSSRIVVLAVHTDGAGVNVSNVTVGGSSMALIQDTTGQPSCCLAHLGVPASTAADIVVTFSGAAQRCGIGVWSIVGAATTVPLSSTYQTASASTAHAVTVDLPTDAMGVVAISLASDFRMAWTGGTEEYDAGVEALMGKSGVTLTGGAGSGATVRSTHGSDSGRIVGATWL
jgi:hypothetical protein